MKNIRNKFKFLKNYDLFGHPVTLSMNEKTFYKTVFGGMVSFILEISFLLLIIYSLNQLFSNQYVQTSRYDINLIDSFGKLALNQKEFALALKFDTDILNNWTNPYMNISLIQTHLTRSLNDSINKKKVILPLKPCKIEDFKDFQVEFKKLGIANALCPENNVNFSMIGAYEENIFDYFQIKVSVCNEANCQTKEAIEQVVQSIGYYLIFLIINLRK